MLAGVVLLEDEQTVANTEAHAERTPDEDRIRVHSVAPISD